MKKPKRLILIRETLHLLTRVSSGMGPDKEAISSTDPCGPGNSPRCLAELEQGGVV